MSQREGARPLSSVLALRRQLEADLRAERQRAARAEARLAEAQAEAARALEGFEERRIVAAELRTMLDATEYRITTLEAEVRLRESELRSIAEAHRGELETLRAEHGILLEKLADADRARAAERQEWSERLAVLERTAAHLEEDRDGARVLLEERSAACASLAEQHAAALALAADRDSRLAQTTAILEEAFTESAGLRATLEELRQQADAEQAAAAAARGEHDSVLGRLSDALAELAAATERAGEIERGLAEQHLLRGESEQRAQALAEIAHQREARVVALEGALADLGVDAERRDRELAESDRRAQNLAELVREREGGLAEREALLVSLRAENGQLEERAREAGAALADATAALEDLRIAHRGLAGEHEDLRKSLAASDGTVHDLRSDAEERGREVARLTAELRGASEGIAHLEGQIAELQHRNARAAEERERLAAAVARLEREHLDAEDRAGRAERALDEATVELDARAARLIETGAAHADLLADIGRARCEIEDLRRATEEAAGTAADRDDRIRALEAEQLQAAERAAALSSEIDAASEALARARRERDAAAEHGRQIEAERLRAAERAERLTHELEAVREALDCARREHGVAAEQGARAENERQQAAERAAELSRELESLREVLDAAERERGVAAEENARAEAERRQAEDRADQLTRELETARHALDAAHRQVAVEVDQRARGEAERQQTAERAEQLTRELEALREALDAARREHGVAAGQGARAEADRQQAAERAAELSRELESVRQALDVAERERGAAEAEWQQAAERAERLASDLGALRETLDAAQRERGMALEQGARADAERQQASERVAELARTLEEARDALGEARRDRDAEAERVNRAEAARQEAAERAADLARELEASREALDASRREHVVAAEQTARAEDERSQAIDRAAQLAREVEVAREALGAASSDHERALRALSDERDDLERRAGASAREISELGELLRVAGQELEEVRRSEAARRAEVQGALDALHAEREALLARTAAAEEGRARAEQALERHTAHGRQHVEDVGVLRDALQRAEAASERALDARAQLAGERDDMEREMLVWRDRAEAAQAENATLVAQLAEAAAAPSSPEMAMRITDLEQTLQLARLKESALQNAVNDIQEQLLREQAHAAQLWSDVETQTRFREALDSALADSRSRCGELETSLEQVRAEPHAAGAERAVEIETRLREAEAALDAATTERAALQSTIDDLHIECEQLRRRAPGADDRERPRAELVRLQGKIEELERQQREAVQRHTAAVNGYMLELNQRTETLRQRDAEINRLSEENAVLQAACDDAVGQVADMRSDREGARRQREGESWRPAPRPERGEAAAPVRGREAGPEPKREELRLSEPKPAAEEKKRPLLPPARKVVARATDEPITIIHVDEDAQCQEAVRTMLASFPRLRYLTLAEAEQQPVSGRRVLAVNMLCRGTDPITAVVESQKLGIEDPRAFTYFGYAGRGFVLGMVDFFPHPFETDACASRLLGRPGGLQRLLAVSEDVDLMSGIREVLGRVRCSTATAFDARQGLDLVPMIKPEVVLVDLALPRGEALRVVSRLRSDPKTASVSIAMLWTSPLTAKEIAQSALRVARDFPLTHEEVARGFERALVDEDSGLMSNDAIREVG